MSAAFSLDAWRDFFLALATATAALLGLMFVAMSVRANEIAASPPLRKRAQISIQGMATILILALSALIPQMANLWFSVVLVLVVLVNASVYVMATGKVVRQAGGQSRGAWIRTVANGIAGVLAISAAISMSLKAGEGLYLLVPTLLIILALWCIAAWHLIFPPELPALADSAVARPTSPNSRPKSRTLGRRRRG